MIWHCNEIRVISTSIPNPEQQDSSSKLELTNCKILFWNMSGLVVKSWFCTVLLRLDAQDSFTHWRFGVAVRLTSNISAVGVQSAGSYPHGLFGTHRVHRLGVLARTFGIYGAKRFQLRVSSLRGGPSLHMCRSLQVREAQRRFMCQLVVTRRLQESQSHLTPGGGCRDGSQCTKCHECFWSRVPAGPRVSLTRASVRGDTAGDWRSAAAELHN